ncbi:MAG: HEPN domain-containing protein [Desulfuromonadales bacterium]|nr:HEPN domain-containing protein [Desulfuromonadales bacterium]
MKASTAEWVRAAELDLLAVERLLGDFRLSAILAFHVQQVAEKLFKALLEEHDTEPPKTHSLLALYKRVIAVTPGFELDDTAVLVMLDQLYIDARYPGEHGLLPHGMPDNEDARMFCQFANGLLKQVVERLV